MIYVRRKNGAALPIARISGVEMSLVYIHLLTMADRLVKGISVYIHTTDEATKELFSVRIAGYVSEKPFMCSKYFCQQMARACLPSAQGVATAWSEAFCYSNDNVHRLQLSGNLY